MVSLLILVLVHMYDPWCESVILVPVYLGDPWCEWFWYWFTWVVCCCCLCTVIKTTATKTTRTTSVSCFDDGCVMLFLINIRILYSRMMFRWVDASCHLWLITYPRSWLKLICTCFGEYCQGLKPVFLQKIPTRCFFAGAYYWVFGFIGVLLCFFYVNGDAKSYSRQENP